MDKRLRMEFRSAFNRKSKACPELGRRIQNLKFVVVLAISILASVQLAEAQQAKVYRVGVVLQGGAWYEAIDGLREGLRELGYEEGKQFVLEMRDGKGDLKAVEEAARNLEQGKVNLIYAVATSVVAAVKQVTTDIPIVFGVGSDPVNTGLIQSFVKPGGRLTGVHFLVTDLTAKRLEILKEILPKASRVVTFYNPNNRVASESAKLAREEAKRLGLKFIERHVASVEELRKALQRLKAGEADAYLYIAEAMVGSQVQLIIDTARATKLPTMFHEQSLVAKGGLASYGVSYHGVGRLSAKYVQRVLTGTHPRDLRVETVDKIELVINLKTGKALGLTIPPNVLARADKVIK